MRPTLPAAPSLPVEHLAAGFGDGANSYKFYWLAERPAMAEERLPIYRLRFGKQVRLGRDGGDAVNSAPSARHTAQSHHRRRRTEEGGQHPTAARGANPAAPGHALVIPKLHVASYFDLPEKVRTACWLVVERVCGMMMARGGVEGVQVCVDVGAAGQIARHLVIDVMSCYTRNDQENP